ncbi:interferon-induced helicase C domain-containing protein 1-like [Mytilus edulis]|uniref:interferon-induced helicase C domain-containing protein 1-like n=1 Tax=Mytilus edulis TaxID=6550 RepID=UPI0039EFA713
MKKQDDPKDLHAKLKGELCEHINHDIEKSEFDKVKNRVKHRMTPKDFKDAVDMHCLLDILEKKNILKVGKYDSLIQIFEECDVRIVENVIQPAAENIKRILDMKHTIHKNDEEDSSNSVSSDKSSEKIAEDDNDMAINPTEVNKTESIIQSDSMDAFEHCESTSTKQVPSCKSDSKTPNEINSVGAILRFLGVEKYIKEFEDQEIDIDSFWTLKAEDLEQMGINKIGPKSKIMKYIEENAKSSIFSNQSTTVLNSQQLYPFQRELLEIPLSGKNTIVYARTNAGKTLIAFNVIADHLEKNPKGKVLFTARTNLLLHQQFERAQERFSNKKIDVFCLTAYEDRTDYTFSNVMKVYNVFFMTPQLFVNNLRRNDDLKVNIDDFTLLVFDECHHTMGFDAYNSVMAFYRLKKFHSATSNPVLPQTLGLTASPNIYISRTEADAVEHVKMLMANLDVVKLSTVIKEKEDYEQRFDTPTNENLPVASRDDDPVQQNIISAIKQVERKMQADSVKHHFNIKDTVWKDINTPPPDRSSMRYSSWLHRTKQKLEDTNYSSMETESTAYKIKRFLHACFRNIEVYLEAYATNETLEYKDVKEELQKECESFEHESQTDCHEQEKELVTIMQEVINGIPEDQKSNPDINKVIKVLEHEYEERGSKSRFLIFVKRRMTAIKLADKLPDFLHSHHLTGSYISEEQGGLSVDEQNDIIERFRIGMHKCIVATSVAFEGIDIPDCNMTIRYKLDANVITSLQMRGRIRRKEGKELIMGTFKQYHKETLNIERQYIMNKSVEMIVNNNDNQALAKELDKLQTDTLKKEEMKRITRNVISKKNAQFDLHCRKCFMFICKGNFLRTLLECHRVVIDIELMDRIKKKPLKKKARFFDGLVKKYKVEGPCCHDWGVILAKDDVDMLCLSQDDIKVYNTTENKYEKNFRKWIEFPFEVDEMTEEEFLNYKKSVKLI